MRKRRDTERRKRRRKRRETRGGFLKGRGDSIEGERAVFLRVLKKEEYWLNWRKKLRTGERRVAGKSLGHEVEKGDFQV